MKQQRFSVRWICAAAFAFLSACSSSDSGTDASDPELSSSSEVSGTSSAAMSSSDGGLSSGGEISSSGALVSSSSAAEGGSSSSNSWQPWSVPTAPVSGSYTAPDSAVLVTLSSEGCVISNAGTKDVSSSGSTLSIKSAGLYVLEGSLADGQIVIQAGSADIVELVMNGVLMGNSTNAPLVLLTGDKLKIELAEGSVNILSDASTYTSFLTSDSVPKACIYSVEDLTIKGNGTLYVNGNYNNGIHTKADLIANDSPKLFVKAAKHALKGKNSVTVNGGEFALESVNGDAVQSDEEDDASQGVIDIESGSFNINAGSDGFNAYQNLTVNGGTFAILAGDGSLDTAVSHKAFKSSLGTVSISAGMFDLVSQEDAIHAPMVSIGGGTFAISSGDDGIQAESSLSVSGGTGIITRSKKPLVIDSTGSSFSVSGGTWLALGGGYSDYMVPGSATAYTAVFELPADIASGSAVSVKDASETEIFGATAGKTISSLFATSPDFAAGETYGVYAAGTLVCHFTFSGTTATSCTAP